MITYEKRKSFLLVLERPVTGMRQQTGALSQRGHRFRSVFSTVHFNCAAGHKSVTARSCAGDRAREGGFARVTRPGEYVHLSETLAAMSGRHLIRAQIAEQRRSTGRLKNDVYSRGAIAQNLPSTFWGSSSVDRARRSQRRGRRFDPDLLHHNMHSLRVSRHACH